MIKYRIDIDGLRALAVIAVILFHLGYLPNGYLGVDIFFVISGYLITSIIYKDLNEQKFSIYRFYERRVRRIIPLLLFITTISLIFGVFLMLPDDLENLAQSVVASNFSVNNILMLITSADYWATKNEYKPLMHTWSLGIEEQYYLIYPFLLLVISKIRLKWINHFLVVTSLISIVLFLFFGNAASRFYLLHFRFFELSVGGLLAVISFHKKVNHPSIKYLFYFSVTGILLLLLAPDISSRYLVVFTTICTVLAVTTGGFVSPNDVVLKYLFQNKFAVYLGKISYSLYLWHQLIFAFSRYAYFEKIGFQETIFLISITFTLSAFTYHFIENPFRDKHKISTKRAFMLLGFIFIISTSSALYIYFIGGVYKDFPEIGLTREDVRKQGYNLFSGSDNIHIHYNEKVRQLDKDFEENDRFKVLIIGDSHGRDVVNIFSESSIDKYIQLNYFDILRIKNDETIAARWEKADLVVVAASGVLDKKEIMEIGNAFHFSIDLEKVVVFGIKNFGYSNGIQYNNMSSINDFSKYYASMREGTMATEAKLQHEWGASYISLITPVINEDGKIRIFDGNGKFISQDTVHLTRAGAKFYATILATEIERILNPNYSSEIW